MPGRPHHSAKWHRCWEKVQEQGYESTNAAAICTAALGDDSYAERTEVARDIHLVAAAGKIRSAQYRGREHVVVPVTALVEGVLHAVNSETPELVLAEEFSIAHTGWNGRPVMMNHPESEGRKCSANDPSVLEASQLGQVFNTKIVNNTLQMEAWIDPERARAIGPEGERTLERINASNTSDPLEVSVGVFIMADAESGEYKGKSYKAVWRHIIPDHLAILSEGKTGACSVSMGCGSRYMTSHEGYEEVRSAGGPGSGNFGHEGRPGAVGGSGGGGGGSDREQLQQEKERSIGRIKRYEDDVARLEAKLAKIQGAQPSLPGVSSAKSPQDVKATREKLKKGGYKEYKEGEKLPHVGVEGINTVPAGYTMHVKEHNTEREANHELDRFNFAKHPGAIESSVTGPQRSNNFYPKWVHEVRVRNAEESHMTILESLKSLVTKLTNATEIADVVNEDVDEVRAAECHCQDKGGTEMTRAERVKALMSRAHNPVKDEKILTAASEEMLKALEDHVNTSDETDNANKKIEDELAAAAKKADEKDADDEEEADDEKKKKEPKAAEMSEDDWMKTAPVTIRDMVARHKAADASAKATLVSTLKGTQKVLSEADLKARTLEQLQEIAKLVKVGVPEVDYSGRSPRAAEESDYLSQMPPDGYKLALEKRAAKH